jgi:uncharacterized protein (TIGR02246 family)
MDEVNYFAEVTEIKMQRIKGAGMNEEHEKQKIREVIDTWLRASAEGDLERVLSLMAEDVVFLLPGQEPMRGRDAFAAASRSMTGKVRFEGTPEIQEIHIAGNYTFCWNYLTVKVTPLPDGPAKRSAGDILSVFRKEPDGRWVLFRDANLLAAK